MEWVKKAKTDQAAVQALDDQLVEMLSALQSIAKAPKIIDTPWIKGEEIKPHEKDMEPLWVASCDGESVKIQYGVVETVLHVGDLVKMLATMGVQFEKLEMHSDYMDMGVMGGGVVPKTALHTQGEASVMIPQELAHEVGEAMQANVGKGSSGKPVKIMLSHPLKGGDSG